MSSENFFLQLEVAHRDWGAASPKAHPFSHPAHPHQEVERFSSPPHPRVLLRKKIQLRAAHSARGGLDTTKLRAAFTFSMRPASVDTVQPVRRVDRTVSDRV